MKFGEERGALGSRSLSWVWNLQDGVSEANIYTGYTGYYFYSFLELKIVNDAIILLNDEIEFCTNLFLLNWVEKFDLCLNVLFIPVYKERKIL